MSTNAEFVLAEDAALKAALTGLTVGVTRGGSTQGAQKVGVWFRWPEKEYGSHATEGLFPFITIDLMDVTFDKERAHSYNYDSMSYIPDETPADGSSQYMSPFPIPVIMRYMIATHSRNALHDRELFRKLLQPAYLPWKFGSLYVPQDDSVRRLDVYDIVQSTDYDSLKKRVYRRVWTAGVSAEMLPENWSAPSPAIQTPITEVDLAVIPSN